MEFVQLYFVANRSFDGGDVIADLAGAVLGGGYGWWKYRETSE
jgi:VanZ family protein